MVPPFFGMVLVLQTKNSFDDTGKGSVSIFLATKNYVLNAIHVKKIYDQGKFL